MNETVVYEIARYKGHKPNAVLLNRLQLIAEDGALRLRDADGKEIACKGTDIASAIGSTPVRGTRLVVQSLCDLGLVGPGPL